MVTTYEVGAILVKYNRYGSNSYYRVTETTKNGGAKVEQVTLNADQDGWEKSSSHIESITKTGKIVGRDAKLEHPYTRAGETILGSAIAERKQIAEEQERRERAATERIRRHNEALARADEVRTAPGTYYSIETIGEERICHLQLTTLHDNGAINHFVIAAFSREMHYGGQITWEGRTGMVVSPRIGPGGGAGSLSVATDLTGDALDNLLINSLIAMALRLY